MQTIQSTIRMCKRITQFLFTIRHIVSLPTTQHPPPLGGMGWERREPWKRMLNSISQYDLLSDCVFSSKLPNEQVEQRLDARLFQAFMQVFHS